MIKGSIVQGHIGRKTGDFHSYIFENNVSCRIKILNRKDEGDIDPLFSPPLIFNQNNRGSKKIEKWRFTSMKMQ